MDEEVYEGDEGYEPQRWDWWTTALVISNHLANIGRLWAATFTEVAVRVLQHKMFVNDRKDFEDEVRLELEALPETKE